MKQKMSIGDKLKFIITGKKPVAPQSVEEKFLEKTHMTKAQAIEKVQIWAKNGEEEKMQQGKKLLEEYFGAEELETLFVEDDKVGAVPCARPDKNSQIKTEHNENITKRGDHKGAPLQKPEKNIFTKLQQGAHTGAPLLETIGVSTKLPEETLPDENSINDDERTFAALSYVPFMAFFVVMTRKDSQFVLFHAWQGITFVAVIISMFVIEFLLSWLPGISGLFTLFYFGLFLAMIFAGYTAWSGRYVQFPIISQIAKSLRQ